MADESRNDQIDPSMATGPGEVRIKIAFDGDQRHFDVAFHEDFDGTKQDVADVLAMLAANLPDAIPGEQSEAIILPKSVPVAVLIRESGEQAQLSVYANPVSGRQLDPASLAGGLRALADHIDAAEA